jgi:hypothetical protein
MITALAHRYTSGAGCSVVVRGDQQRAAQAADVGATGERVGEVAAVGEPEGDGVGEETLGDGDGGLLS